MKVIVCTGDSHTVGQGADSIKTSMKPKDPKAIYNTAGKGISRGGDLSVPSYVNLLRQYIAQSTNSEYALTNGETLGKQSGYPVVNRAVKLDGELVFSNNWELDTICFIEQVPPARVAIYLDGALHRTEILQAPTPRYNDWSFRNVSIPCAGIREIRVVPLEGEVYISHIQHDRGAYAVINSGVGSCTSQRYLAECFDYCVAEFKPHMVIAEGHTINDWLNYQAPEMHHQALTKLLDKMRDLGARLVFTTVAPITGNQLSGQYGQDYADFMAQAMKIAQRDDVVFVNANEKFQQALAAVPAEEQFDHMYVDNWHVNGKGHKIYADAIMEKLKPLL